MARTAPQGSRTSSSRGSSANAESPPANGAGGDSAFTELPRELDVREPWGAVLATRLDQGGQVVEPGLREEDAQAPFADFALAEVGVPVAVAAERRFRVVEMETGEAVGAEPELGVLPLPPVLICES